MTAPNGETKSELTADQKRDLRRLTALSARRLKRDREAAEDYAERDRLYVRLSEGGVTHQRMAEAAGVTKGAIGPKIQKAREKLGLGG